MAKHVVNAVVSYQTYTSIAFDIAKAKGATFDGIEEGGQFISQLADYWNSEGERLEQMTEAQVRNDLQPIIEQ